MNISDLQNLLESLNESEEKAFWNVVQDLPDSIYSQERTDLSVENSRINENANILTAELLALTRHHNVFLRIYKEIKDNDNLEECEKVLKDFYNNPDNETAWNRESLSS